MCWQTFDFLPLVQNSVVAVALDCVYDCEKGIQRQQMRVVEAGHGECILKKKNQKIMSKYLGTNNAFDCCQLKFVTYFGEQFGQVLE